MSDKYLVINAGSSSLKFSLYDSENENVIVSGNYERIGIDNSFYTIKYQGVKEKHNEVITNHDDAVSSMLHMLITKGFILSINEIKGIGHRVLHGGEKYSDSVLIDDEVYNDIVSLTKLGPLHHPGELSGISSMSKLVPNASQIAVFDTAFHQSIPKENYLYAVPYSWYEENDVRKYGFHGTSHKYITNKCKEILDNETPNLIICHIGSGASIACIKEGKCINTTMGLTPLDGLIMGTRSGSIDPSILEYIAKERNMDIKEICSALNKQSGLLALCGKNDYRDVEALKEKNDENATLAIKMFEKSIIKYIAQYYVELNASVDALIFTAGIGENSANLRKDIINKISLPMHINLNEEENNKIASFKEKNTGVISTDESNFKVLVIPTNEEYMIYKDTKDICKNIDKKRVRR